MPIFPRSKEKDSLSNLFLVSQIDKIDMSAGVTPLIRAAWPTVSGRTFESFCRVSELSPAMLAKLNPSGILWRFFFDRSFCVAPGGRCTPRIRRQFQAAPRYLLERSG